MWTDMNALLEFAFHVICVYCTVVEKMLFRALYFVLILQIGNRVHAVVASRTRSFKEKPSSPVPFAGPDASAPPDLDGAEQPATSFAELRRRAELANKKAEAEAEAAAARRRRRARIGHVYLS